MKVEEYGQEAQESSSPRFATAVEVSRLKEKMDDVAFMVGMIYKMLRSNAIRIRIEDIQVRMCPREERSEEL